MENNWIAVENDNFPVDGENVQVTYLGYNDKKLYCDGFAFRSNGRWLWTHNDSVVRVTIVAWKHNCEPYRIKLYMEKRLKALYKEVNALLNLAPCEDDCTDEENRVYSEMANLKEALFDIGYGD